MIKQFPDGQKALSNCYLMVAVAAQLAQLAMQLADHAKSVSSEHFYGVLRLWTAYKRRFSGPEQENAGKERCQIVLQNWSQASRQLEQNRTEAKRPMRTLKEEAKETVSKQKARDMSQSQTGFQVVGGSFAK